VISSRQSARQLPTVIMGIVRYARQGSYRDRSALTGTVAPMAVGSVLGAVIGGPLVSFAPVPVLKVGLGIIPLVSVVRIFGRGHGRERSSDQRT